MQQWTISQLDCDVRQKVDYIWQLVMTSSVAGPRRNSKALSKAKFVPKKDHDHCLVVCCPCDPLQLSEAQQNHHIWEVCSANRWDPLKLQHLQPVLVNRKETSPFPERTSHNQCFKCWTKWALKFCLICQIQIPDLSPTNFHFFKHLNNFLQGEHFCNQQEAENVFQEFVESQSTDFLHYRN